MGTCLNKLTERQSSLDLIHLAVVDQLLLNTQKIEFLSAGQAIVEKLVYENALWLIERK